MECVILWRNIQSDEVSFISRSDGDYEYIAVFPNYDEAISWADQSNLLNVHPYQIVELDEL